MNAWDYAVLFATLLGIAGFGIWRTRGRRDLSSYLRGRGTSHWLVIGLSVMATQASAVTFLSTPGQGYQGGMGFVQNYFGAPLALIFISIVFLPIYRRLNIFTAYEYLGKRFDAKTRLLGAGLFLVQRGIGAGITIYAPAIVLSTVFGWPLNTTILLSGLVVIAYTVAGGSDAVTLTQKYQMIVIFAGMIAAFFILLARMPHGTSFSDCIALGSAMHKMKAVDFSTSLHPRYTLYSGTIGGMFLALYYFGADQSQVQRYISSASLRDSRMGLMFNAVVKVPMQYFVLLLGVMLFVFYQFEKPPIFFDQPAWNHALALDTTGRLQGLDDKFLAVQGEKSAYISEWMTARHAGDTAAAAEAQQKAIELNQRATALHDQAAKEVEAAGKNANDADYVFITFILHNLPHGMIGLLVTVFFAAALNAKAAELNALASTTVVDIYRHIIHGGASDRHYFLASRWFTVMWGCVALGFAMVFNMVENLVQAANIVASIFYPVILGVFLVGFFLKRIGGTAVFVGAILAQALVLAMYYHNYSGYIAYVFPALRARLDRFNAALDISYLWYNVIGAVACILFSTLLQAGLGKRQATPVASETA